MTSTEDSNANVGIDRDDVVGPNVEDSPRERHIRSILLKLAGWLITLGVLYWTFAVLLPGKVDVDEVWSALAAVSVGNLILLTITGLLTILSVGWTASAVLPGLPLWKGTEASATGQLTAIAIPPPGDLLIRFAMYRTYGFSDDRSAIAVTLSGIARYATVVAMPFIGCGLVILTGRGSTNEFVWFVILGLILVVGLWLVLKVIASDKFALKVGSWVQSVVGRTMRLIRKHPPDDLQHSVLEFGQRMRLVVETNLKLISVSNILWGFASALVMLIAMRASGLGESSMSVTQAVLVTGAALLINSVPITPGGIGVTEAVLLSIVNFNTPTEQAAFTAGLFLYRGFTWLLPLPIGAVTFCTWRYRVHRLSKQPKAEPTPV